MRIHSLSATEYQMHLGIEKGDRLGLIRPYVGPEGCKKKG